MRKNPYVTAQRDLDEARDAFVRAAAALTQGARYSKSAVASALLEASYGMLQLSKGDLHESGLKEALVYLKKLRGEKA